MFNPVKSVYGCLELVRKMLLPVIFLAVHLGGCDGNHEDLFLEITGIYVGMTAVDLSGGITDDVPVDQAVAIAFSSPVDVNSVADAVSLQRGSEKVDVEISYFDNNKTVALRPLELLASNEDYKVAISDQLKGAKGERFSGIQASFRTVPGILVIESIRIGDQPATSGGRTINVPLDATIEVEFSAPVDIATVAGAFSFSGPGLGSLAYSYSNANKKIIINRSSNLQPLRKYTFAISTSLKGAGDETFSGLSREFYSAVDPAPKFPVISDEELLTLVQRQTFKYFWDFAHPASGMARERNTSGDIVTIGGSGFGVMGIIVGIERGFITRAEGVERLEKIVDFLMKADRFHGVWPHWLNGSTGKVVPFSPDDNGGDLVETAFMIQGLLTVRQYLNEYDVREKAIMDAIVFLWDSIEWDWYTRDGQNVLYWHWSPDYGWQKNHKIQGWNEALIIYVLAASSKNHGIAPEVYHEGWARGGTIVNGQEFFGITLPLGEDRGGPLFFSHYSFLGLDPRKLQDRYAGYWEQNVAHTRINRAYCIANPKNYVAYSGESWGLTASDGNLGYSAHSPNNDRGVITPTAALSSFPYTPVESMQALKFFYYTIGDKLWGEYGFYDAFNATAEWYAGSYIAIDQGPIIVMIENYRTGLLWNLFMSDPEVQRGLDRLGFTY